MDPFLDGCNPEQRAAILHDHAQNGPLLVLAGAGTGKTTVLTRRLARLCQTGTPPDRILALTFTRAAAEEMKKRALALCRTLPVERGDPARMTVCTFHSLAFKILKREGAEPEPPPDEERPLDFDNMISETNRLLETDREVLEKYRGKFSHLLVDEYQDTDPAQCRMLKLLAGNNRNVFAVGDDDQAIYRFRGADVGNILNFQKDFPGAALIKLETNYRSTPAILALANHVFRHKPVLFRKNLRPHDGNTHPLFRQNLKIGLFKCKDEAGETGLVTGEITRLVERERLRLKDIAILFRLNHQREHWEEALKTAGLDGVNLSTFHGAKGLEYPAVFVVGLEERVFPMLPDNRATKQEKQEALEEEKRLFYVAVTRAKYRLVLTSAKSRKWYGRTRQFKRSRFLKCVPWRLKEHRPFFTFIRDVLLEKPGEKGLF